MIFDPRPLRHARREAELSEARIAAAIGRSASMLSRYERGRDLPRADTLAAWLHVLGVGPGDVFRPTP